MEQFYNKRFAKIWPFFTLLCLFDLIISPSINSLYEVFANLTLCFGLLPNPKIAVIGVGWFIGLVFVFYLLFPFFCFLLSNKSRAWFSFVIALLFHFLCANYFFDVQHMPESFFKECNFIYSAVYFLAGGLIFLYRDFLIRSVERYGFFVLIMCMVVLIAHYMLGGYVIVKVLLFSLFLIYAIGSSGKFLQNTITRFTSGISMEIYLSHMVIFRIIEKFQMTHLFTSDSLSYAVTLTGTIIGAMIFSVSVNKGFFLISNILSENKV